MHRANCIHKWKSRHEIQPQLNIELKMLCISNIILIIWWHHGSNSVELWPLNLWKLWIYKILHQLSLNHRETKSIKYKHNNPDNDNEILMTYHVAAIPCFNPQYWAISICLVSHKPVALWINCHFTLLSSWSSRMTNRQLLNQY